MATFAERLKIALQNKGMKQTVLAYRIGVDRSYISNYLSGKYKPSAETHNKIARVLEVSEMWLSGYDVPMQEAIKEKENTFISYKDGDIGGLRKDLSDIIEAYKLKHPLEEISEGKQKLIDYVMTVPENKAEKVLKIIQAIVEDN